MGNIIAAGMEKKFQLKVFEDDQLSSKLSSYIAGEAVPSESPLAKCTRIDPNNFYHAENVRRAIVGGKDYSDIPLDSSFMASMLECERYFMSTMDRLTAVPDSHNSKKELFIELLRFFNSYLIGNPDIKFVFFRSTPHFGWDLVLYFVARYHGLKTLIMNRTDISNQFIIRHDWRNPIVLHNKPVQSGKISSNNSKYSNDKDSEFTRYSKSIISKHSDSMKKKSWYGPILSVFRWLKLIARISLQRNIVSNDSALFRTRRLNKPKLFRLNVQRALVNAKTLRTYRELMISEPALDKKYIYFALHFQPERSTQPEGGFFDQQYLAVSLLATALPSDWRIYVKEHPRQFDVWPPDLRKMYARSDDFYKKLVELGNVSLIDPSFDSEELVEHAQLTGTITGTSSGKHLKESLRLYLLIHGIRHAKVALLLKVSKMQGSQSIILHQKRLIKWRLMYQIL